MRTHHFYIGLVGLVIIGGGIFYIVHYRQFPTAVINGSMIFADEFERVAFSALQFYVKSTEATKRRALTQEEVDALYSEIRRATLDKLMSERLVDNELARRFGGNVEEMAGEKLVVADTERLRDVIAPLYGMTFEEFRMLLLLPEAKREVLNDALRDESRSAESWLNDARRNARVIMLLPNLVWKNGGVEISK